MTSAPFDREHLPDEGDGADPVSLHSISHYEGVNALAQNQTLRFSPRLTVVYGDNAAGKTGYIRILKGACRARGQEHILGNVVAGAAPPPPAVAIKYRLGAEPEIREWARPGDDESVSRVSVFDTKCASVYLTEPTDVAYRPLGLDLFDKLVQACQTIRSQLEKEQRALVSNELAPVQALAAARALRGLHRRSPPREQRLAGNFHARSGLRPAHRAVRVGQANSHLSVRTGRHVVVQRPSAGS